MQQMIGHALPDEKDLRAYAADKISWKVMRDKGFSYSQVLDGLGFYGLSLPIQDTPETRATSARILEIFRKAEAEQQRARG